MRMYRLHLWRFHPCLTRPFWHIMMKPVIFQASRRVTEVDTMLFYCCTVCDVGLLDQVWVATRRWANVVSMLGQRWRRWANIKTTLVQRLVFTWPILFTHNFRTWPSLKTCFPFRGERCIITYIFVCVGIVIKKILIYYSDIIMP